MAEFVVTPLVSLVLLKLSSLIGDEIISLWGLQDDLEGLKSTISRIHAVLCDADEKPSLNNQEQELVGKLKDVLYDAEDLLERAAFEAQQQKEKKEKAKVVRIISSSSKLLSHFTAAHELKKVRETIDSIAKDISIKIEANNMKRQELHTCSLVHEEIVIGRKEDIDAVKKHLLNSDTKENVSVISVVGIGGLGKTTLARVLYNDLDVKACFDKQIWVFVSHEFDVRIIVKKILEIATGRTPEVSELESLKKHLSKLINGKEKYMLVLDSVWNDKRESWQELKALLRGGARGSKILITARSKLVGEAAGVSYSHVLKGLSSFQSWQLFENIVFKQAEDFKTPEIVKIGKKIVKKCSGVPLAIKTMGALLSTRKTYTGWLEFKDQDLLTIVQAKNDIRPILKLSYDYLTPCLKQCFVYCSLFPKGHEIHREKLIRLWIAQGFVPPSYEYQQNLEDIFDQYFRDLIGLSFFQEVKKDECGFIRSIKMNDLMHDLATSLGEPECTSIDVNLKRIFVKTRHVSFKNEKRMLREWPLTLPGVKGIRSFLLVKEFDVNSCKKFVLNKSLSSYKSLRVLDLYGLRLKELSKSIGELKHLRYLDLSRNWLKKLPDCITTLQNLQTLNLADNSYLEELPTNLKNLKNLRHLILDGCCNLNHMPHGIGQLTDLRTLSMFIISIKKSSYGAGLCELKDLCNLRGCLKIINRRCERELIDPEILSTKNCLDSLTINFGCCFNDKVSSMDDEATLEGIRQLRNLKELMLDGYRGKQSGKEQVSNQSGFYFPKLLKLCICHSTCKHLLDSAHLPSLKFIELFDLADFDTLSLLTGHPCLQTINISNMIALQHVTALIDLPCLEDIYFDELAALSKFPSLSQLPCLKRITLAKLTALTNISSLHELPSLEYLYLSYLTALEYLQEEDIAVHSDPRPPFFPSLKTLFLLDMPKLKGWLKQPADNGDALKESSVTTAQQTILQFPQLNRSNLQRLWNKLSNIFKKSSAAATQQNIVHFPVLSNLTVNKCPQLMEIPFFPHLEELDLRKTCGKLLQHQLEETKHWVIKQASMSRSFSPFSKLVHLQTDKFEDLPDAFMQNLTSLREMEIYNHVDVEMESLPEKFRAVSGSLESLCIMNLKSMPLWMKEFTSLRSIEVWQSNYLPEGLDRLISLEGLKLESCPGLTALPESFTALTSLKELNIKDCPELRNKCKKKKDADWRKIQHIPYIVIDEETIQDTRRPRRTHS